MLNGYDWMVNSSRVAVKRGVSRNNGTSKISSARSVRFLTIKSLTSNGMMASSIIKLYLRGRTDVKGRFHYTKGF
jgi:hypothetical protein